MKLLTHNMLSSKCIKGVNLGYPLEIVARDIKIAEVDFNSDFVSRVLPKLDYSTLYKAAESLGQAGEVPQTLIENYESNDDFLRKVHHILLEVEVIDGELICPETGRKFPITAGIPDMLLNSYEVEVIDGDLICPETGRKFPINSGIPNMLLNEDEV